MAVAAGHAAQLEIRYLPDPLMSPVWMMGFSGVDLFFVISGFVMVHVTGPRGRPSERISGHFLLARLTRIFPPYWLYTLLALAGVLLIPSLGDGRIEAGPLIRSVLLIPDWTQPFLPVGWTLIHELYFYIVFAAFLFAPRSVLPALLILWLSLTTTGYLGGLNHGGPLLHLLVHPLTTEFVLGALIGLYGLRGGRIAGLVTVTAGITLFAGAVLLLQPVGIADLPGNWMRVAVQGVPAALLLYGAVTLERSGLTVPRALVSLGDWSYSMYLGHGLILAGGIAMWPRIVPNVGAVDNLFMLTAGLTACVAAAALSYRLFERPVLNLAYRLRDRLYRDRENAGPPAGYGGRIW